MLVAAGGIVSRVFGFGVNEVLDGIGQWVGDGASEMLKLLGHVLDASTRPQLDAPWFSGHFRNMAGLAGLLVLPMLLAAIMRAVVRQDVSELVRSVLVHLPLAALLTAVAVELVQLSLAGVDFACAYVSSAAGGDTQAVVSSVTGALERTALALGQPGAPSFVLFLGGLVVAIAAVLLWLELVLRTAAIYVAVLFLPLALATLVWPAVSHWCRRLTETLAALILSKLVVVAVLSLAAGALAGQGGSADLSGVLSGAALLLLSAFAPFALFRLIPVVEAGAVMHLEGLTRRASSSALSSTAMVPSPILAPPSGQDEALTVSVGEVAGEPGLGSGLAAVAGSATAGAATAGAVAATGGAAAAAEGAGGAAGGSYGAASRPDGTMAGGSAPGAASGPRRDVGPVALPPPPEPPADGPAGEVRGHGS